jgi:hypothetical protein
MCEASSRPSAAQRRLTLFRGEAAPHTVPPRSGASTLLSGEAAFGPST